MLITDQSTLLSLCDQWAKESFITVDTEFLRDKTYFPQLCLIQIADSNQAYAIDPLAATIDLTPLFTVFSQPTVIKVFHSARQDIEIILALSGKIPAPLFDTQVAAMVCGFGEAASYETLVQKLAGKSIDKSCRFTDWSHRPLSDRQLAYALSDVSYLRIVYEKLRDMLDKNDRFSWLSEEMSFLTSPANYTVEPEDAWKKIRLKSSSPAFVERVKLVAAWREQKAREMNVPRTHLLKDATLLEVVASMPKTLQEFYKIRSISKHLIPEAAAGTLVHLLTEDRTGDTPKMTPPQNLQGGGPLVDLLKVLLKMQCEQHGVAEKLVASSQDLAKIAHSAVEAGNEEIPALCGWRYELFGQYALALKEGKIALSALHNTLRMIDISKAPL